MAESESSLPYFLCLWYKNNKSEHITYHGNEVRIYRIWQGQKESNPRHAVLETAALPAELYPCTVGYYTTNKADLQEERREKLLTFCEHTNS